MIYASEARDLSLFMVGDVMPTRRLRVFDEPDYIDIVGRARAADVAFANLETTVRWRAEGAPNFTQGTPMTTSPDLLKELEWFGLNLFSNANNHATDYGPGGVEATLRHMRNAHMVVAGSGLTLSEARAPAYLDTRAGRVALVAVTAFFRPWNRAAPQRGDAPGRPGIAPLAFERSFTLPPEEFAALERISNGLGLKQEAARHRQMFYSATEAPPEKADRLRFQGSEFHRGEEFSLSTDVREADADATLKMLREAKRQADWVIFSFHFHEIGGAAWTTAGHESELDLPAEFVRSFSRRAIDAGADVVAGHGPHMTLGVEIYRGKPILYSLGNFIFQNDTVEVFPAEAYGRFGLDEGATPADFLDARTGGETRGFPAHPEYWRGLAADCEFHGGELSSLRLIPLDLGYGQPRSERGRPVHARGETARQVLERVATASRTFGTAIDQDHDEGLVKL